MNLHPLPVLFHFNSARNISITYGTEATILNALIMDLLGLYPFMLQNHHKNRKTLIKIWKVELCDFVAKYVIFFYIRDLQISSKLLNASLVIDILVHC